jgi:hypothetical protein
MAEEVFNLESSIGSGEPFVYNTHVPGIKMSIHGFTWVRAPVNDVGCTSHGFAYSE